MPATIAKQRTSHGGRSVILTMPTTIQITHATMPTVTMSHRIVRALSAIRLISIRSRLLAESSSGLGWFMA